MYERGDRLHHPEVNDGTYTCIGHSVAQPELIIVERMDIHDGEVKLIVSYQLARDFRLA